MSAIIIDGKEVARLIREQLGAKAKNLTPNLGRKPCLAIVLVGDNPASKVYVQAKTKAAINCGITPLDILLPGNISNTNLIKEINQLSLNKSVDGILLQLPLPSGLDEFSALLAIDPGKDVDGLHPVSQGLLMRGAEGFQPCTPLGVIELIIQARKNLGLSEDLSGLRAVVLGRSILVGKPVALMLLQKNCTVSVCHSRTKQLKEECQRADILVAAIGKPEMVNSEFIKPGAIVIDVGINRVAEGRLVGDVEFDSAKEVAAAITPVPGGVGPMTIAMLLVNTVLAAEKNLK